MFSFSIVFTYFLLLCLGVGISFIIGGWLMQKYPPKKINFLYGYRTSSSMKTQERWDFAQGYAAKEIKKSGWIHILVGLASIPIYIPPGRGLVYGIVASLLLVILMIYRVERAIWKNFPKS